jgi:site-specific recombinase XerD
MSHPFCPNPIAGQRGYTGPLGTHIDPFVQQLCAQGYASWTAKYTTRLLADLSRWLQHYALTATDLNEQRVDEFLHDRYRCYRYHRDDRPTLSRWLEYLRNQDLIPRRVIESNQDPHDQIVCDFQHYLLQQRGLLPTTVGDYLNTVRCFLRGRFGAQPPSLEVLCPQDITDFMLLQARRYSPARAKLLAAALRSFFRCAFQRGAIATDLAQAVPTVPNWRLSDVPRFMKAEDVDALLQHCDRSTPKGQRDYAILLLLARLGLRAGEVAALTLDDLQWETGELLIRGKGARHDRLPLPHEVGEAVAVYLRHSRPPSATRQVFIRMRAPRRGFRNGHAVGTVVYRALARAGLNPAVKGAHLLRHTLATQLLHNGASLTEIGELLRHQHIETTRIYAKVDQKALGALALPWPGGEV